MSISIKIPEEVYREAKAIADADHISVDEVIVSAINENPELKRSNDRRGANLPRTPSPRNPDSFV